MRRLYVLGLLLGLLVPLFAAQSNRDDDLARIRSATQVLHEIQSVPDQAIPNAILSGAACIAVIPSEKKFALGIGGSYGKGLVTCRNGNRWSAPAFITVGGGSWGFQIGGEASDVVMMFRNRRGVERLLSNKLRIGADASAAAGPVGRHAAAATDATLNAEILTYARSRGAFAGVSLNGAIVQPDESGNIAMYGRAARHQQILSGEVRAPAAAQPLLQEVATITGTGPVPR